MARTSAASPSSAGLLGHGGQDDLRQFRLRSRRGRAQNRHAGHGQTPDSGLHGRVSRPGLRRAQCDASRRFPRTVSFATRAIWPLCAVSETDCDLARTNKPNDPAFAEQPIRRDFGRADSGARGVNVPPPAFVPLLRSLCDQYGALLILDEIFTGFGRTGKWFACEHSQTRPDLICLGKALTGGFPLSACVGRAELMDAAWPPSSGEAIHTSTFQGHPVGCAMALAQIQAIKVLALPDVDRRSGHVSDASIAGGNFRAGAFHRNSRRRFDGGPRNHESRRRARPRLSFWRQSGKCCIAVLSSCRKANSPT